MQDMPVITGNVSNKFKFMVCLGVYNKKKFTVPARNKCHFLINEILDKY